jgi:DNA-directed RNA polymerase specialized sigma24 family protein
MGYREIAKYEDVDVSTVKHSIKIACNKILTGLKKEGVI